MVWQQRLRQDKVLLLVALPGIASLLVFHYLPLLGNVIAFKDYQPFIGILDSPWIGMANFSIIVNGAPAFVNALVNTLIITTLQVVIVFPVPIGLARRRRSGVGVRADQHPVAAGGRAEPVLAGAEQADERQSTVDDHPVRRPASRPELPGRCGSRRWRWP